MSSKFSDQVAQGMSQILKNESFYKPFNKVTIKTASNEDVFNITDLESRYPDAYNALLDSDKEKFKFYTFYLNDAGKICAKEVGGTDEYLFDHSPNHEPTWIKIASSDEQAFEIYAAKKKKDKKDDDKDEKEEKKSKKDEDKDEKSDKKDKKSKSKSKDDEDDEEEDDKKSKKKKSKKDEDKNDAMALIFAAAKKSKEDKKDGEDKTEKAEKSDDKDDKKDKPKGKKKQFPFWLKKKKAGVCAEDCDCNDCMESDDEMYASAIRHIVESFTKTSAALDNMGLEKSSVATMAILNHIIEEAAYIKMAEASIPHLSEKLKALKDKFKKMHSKDEAYDKDAAEELDEKITEIEEKIEKLKKADSNDVRGTDLLLGLDDPEAREGFLDEGLDDPHSSAALEEILGKNPKLVDEIAPRLQSQFSDHAVEEQLKNRIKSRLPSVIETPENSDISEILKAYNEVIPHDAKIPSESRETIPLKPKFDPLKTKIDDLSNASDGMDDDKLVKIMVKELQNNFDDYDDSGEVNCTKLAENMADEHDLFEGNDDKIPDYVFDCAAEAAEKYESLKDNDEENDELNFDANDMTYAFDLVNKWVKEADDVSFEDNDDSSVTQADLKSILDVIGGYSDKEIAQRESAMNPSDLDAYTQEYYDAAEKK